MCLGAIIDKTRHLVQFQGNAWEIDEFHGDNSGLIVAEIELETAKESSSKTFLGR